MHTTQRLEARVIAKLYKILNVDGVKVTKKDIKTLMKKAINSANSPSTK